MERQSHYRWPGLYQIMRPVKVCHFVGLCSQKSPQIPGGGVITGAMILAVAAGSFFLGHLAAWALIFYIAGRQAIRDRRILNGES
jgi:hypothetical protein